MKVMFVEYDDRYPEDKDKFKIGDIVYVKHWDDNVYEAFDNHEFKGKYIGSLFDFQFTKGVVATDLSRFMYPNAIEKEGHLWVKTKKL